MRPMALIPIEEKMDSSMYAILKFLVKHDRLNNLI